METNNTLLILPEVQAITRLSKPTIYKMVKEGKFPRQLQIGENRVAWLKSDITDWIGSRPRERRPK
jgi:prophage regulatory protein